MPDARAIVARGPDRILTAINAGTATAAPLLAERS